MDKKYEVISNKEGFIELKIYETRTDDFGNEYQFQRREVVNRNQIVENIASYQELIAKEQEKLDEIDKLEK